MGKSLADKEKKGLIHFQVEWVEDLKFVLKNSGNIKKSIKKELQEKVGDKKAVSNFVNVFYRLYLYMLKNDLKNVATFLKGYIFITKVDVFGKNLICVAVLEDEVDDYLDVIVDFIGGKIPDLTDYNAIYKAIWRYEFQRVLSLGVVFLVLLVAGYFAYKFVSPYFSGFLKKKNKVSFVAQQSQQVQMDFSDEEKKRASVLVFMGCLDDLKNKLVEYSVGPLRGHVRVERINFVLAEDSQRVGCNVNITEEYDFPAEETVKSGDYYKKEFQISKSMTRDEFLKRADLLYGVLSVNNYERCLRVLFDLGGEVVERKGGVVSMRVETNLTPRQAVLLPDFLKELVKVCGWDVLKIRQFDLSTGEGANIKFSADISLKDIKK